jgi:hypothetical protein
VTDKPLIRLLLNLKRHEVDTKKINGKLKHDVTTQEMIVWWWLSSGRASLDEHLASKARQEAATTVSKLFVEIFVSGHTYWEQHENV